MAVTPNSFIDYLATSGQSVFPIVRPRISNLHMRVFQNGAILTLTTDYTISDSNVTLVVPATLNDKIRIQRDTPQTLRTVDFMAGAAITERDLDNSALHNLYLAQECWDQVLQMRDTPTVIINWTGGALQTHPANQFTEFSDSRLSPSLGLEARVGQPWIRADDPNNEVVLSPGVYRIDVNLNFTNQAGAGVDSLLSAAICDDVDSLSAVTHILLVNDRPFRRSDSIQGTYLFNVTAEQRLTFKAAVSTGAINVDAPIQWVITRLGGDPELN